MRVKKWGVTDTTKAVMRVSAKGRLLHMKQKDDQSTGLNSKQQITKWHFKQRRRKLKKKSEVRDTVKEAAADKPVLTLLEITLQWPRPLHAGQSTHGAAWAAVPWRVGWHCRVQYAGSYCRNHTSSVQAWVISQQCIHHQGDDASRGALKSEHPLSPTGTVYTEVL